jgi:hypothetical protein
MNKTLGIVTLVIAGLLLAACSSPALAPIVPSREAAADVFMPSIGAGGEGFAPEAPRTGALPAQEFSASEPTSQERLVIQTASVSMVVTDPVEKLAEIRDMAEAMGGFVVSSYVYKTSFGEGLTADIASVTVRVPAERLNEALEEIKADAVEVRTENISGEDVTAQYVDLESRLRNLEAAEEQLTRIMESAEKTEDVLAVYNELVRVRGEIEMVRGQMKYYEESAAFSAISAELIPDVAAQPIEFGGWQPQGTVKAAVEALINALQALVDIGIWAAICVLPIALLIGLPVFLVMRAVRRRRRKTAGEGTNA